MRLFILTCISVLFGVVSVFAASCSKNAKYCNNKKLCIQISFKSDYTWANVEQHIREAQLRGVSCGGAVKLVPLRNMFNKLSLDQRKQLQSNLKDLGFYNSSIDSLYGSGTAGALAAYNKKYLQGADLAKKSNANKLFSVVLSIRSNKKVCSEDVSACAETQLCSRATNYNSGNREWSASKAHVAEAKRRDLNCGIVEKSGETDLTSASVLSVQLEKAKAALAAAKETNIDLSSKLTAALAKIEELEAVLGEQKIKKRKILSR